MEVHLSAMAVLLLACVCCCSAPARGEALIAQITGTSSGLFPHYLVSNVSIGSPPQVQEQLLVSVEGTSVPWVECGAAGAPFDPHRSSTFRPCLDGSACMVTLSGPENGLTGRLATDTFSFHATDSSGKFLPEILEVRAVEFACVLPSLEMHGFRGLLSLSASPHALPSQLSAMASVARKFAYCLPRSPSPATQAPIFFGDGVSYVFGSPPVQINFSDYLTHAHAALFENHSGQLSFKVLSVTLNGGTVHVTNKTLKLGISSVEPYTKLSRSLYLPLRNSFRAQAHSFGIASAPPFSPFDTCFNASTLGFSRVGPHVPTIEFNLVGFAGTNFTWQAFGFQSIVQVSNTTSCWAFLDAGPHHTSLLGTFQQQNVLIEFDLHNKKLSSTGLLDFFESSCTDYVF